MQYFARVFHPRNSEHLGNTSSIWKRVLPPIIQKHNEYISIRAVTRKYHPGPEKGCSQKSSYTSLSREPQLLKIRTRVTAINRGPRMGCTPSPQVRCFTKTSRQPEGSYHSLYRWKREVLQGATSGREHPTAECTNWSVSEFWPQLCLLILASPHPHTHAGLRPLQESTDL